MKGWFTKEDAAKQATDLTKIAKDAVNQATELKETVEEAQKTAQKTVEDIKEEAEIKKMIVTTPLDVEKGVDEVQKVVEKVVETASQKSLWTKLFPIKTNKSKRDIANPIVEEKKEEPNVTSEKKEAAAVAVVATPPASSSSSFSLFGKKPESKKEEVIAPVLAQAPVNPICAKIFKDLASIDGDGVQNDNTINVYNMVTGLDHRVLGFPINSVCSLLKEFKKELIYESEFTDYFKYYEEAKLKAIEHMGKGSPFITHAEVLSKVSENKTGDIFDRDVQVALKYSAVYRQCRHTKKTKLKFYQPESADDSFTYSEFVDFLTLLSIKKSIV